MGTSTASTSHHAKTGLSSTLRAEPDLQLLLFGHSAFQYLHAGVAFDVFEFLEGGGDRSRGALKAHTGLSSYSARLLLFGLASLNLIEQHNGDWSNSRAISRLFLDGHWPMFRDTVLFEAHIVYRGESDFVEALRLDCNVGLRHIPGTGRDLYHRLGENPELSRIFFNYMSSWSRHALPVLLSNAEFTGCSSVLDIGGGDGCVALALATKYQHLHVTIVDIESTRSLVVANIERASLSDRVTFRAVDFLSSELPAHHDCILFAHQLVIWPLETVSALLTSAYRALPSGGRVVIFSSISQSEFGGPRMAALDSVYFACIPSARGMIWSWDDYAKCLASAGFAEIEFMPGYDWTPHGVIVARK